MRIFWARLRAMLVGAVAQRLTLSGAIFSLAILLVGLAAFASANNLLFLLLAAMLSTMLVSGFVSRLSLAGLELQFELPEHITARSRTRGRIFVRNSKTWMPSFSIRLAGSPETGLSSELYFPVIPGGAILEEPVELLFARRGVHKEDEFRFSTRFPFGFTDRRVDVTLAREVLVYPCIEPQADFVELLAEVHGEMEARQRGRGHDFYRIRPYEAFESARHVDWKATAHTGALQVREFAREQEQALDVFLDLNVPPQWRNWFEHSVDCCAYLCWNISRRGARIRFRTQDFDLRLPEEGDAYAVLKYLAVVGPTGSGAVPAPDEDGAYQVLFTAMPARFENTAWGAARLVTPENLPVPPLNVR